MKRYISWMLVALLLLTAVFSMIACTPANPNQPSGPNNPDNPDLTYREPIDYLPTEMYGTEDEPAQYHILQWTVNGEVESGTFYVPWEEMDLKAGDGSALGEAVFNRNALVEDRYGILITTEYGSTNKTPNFYSMLDSDIQGGGGTYDLMTLRSYSIMNQVTNEKCYDMNLQKKYLHFDQPWWVQNSVEAYTTGDSLYAACSEILLRDKGATATLFFNKEVAKDYDELPDFYELVKNKQWDSEEMLLVAEYVSNGGENDMMDSADDFWGMQCGDDTMFYLFNAYDGKFAEQDSKGMLYSTFDGDAVVLMQEIWDTVMFADWYLNTNFGEGKAIAGEKDMFMEGSVFFHPDCLKVASVRLNDMKQDYGILPMPLYDDKEQREYSSLVWVHHDSVLFIPAAASDKEYSAVILEALSWESYYSVSTIFYKDILLARAARETEDKEMIQIILDTRSYDAGQIWADSNITKLQNNLLRAPDNNKDNVNTIWAADHDVFEETLGDINEIIAGIESKE